MKKNLLLLAFLSLSLCTQAQMPGFGQPALAADYKDVNYAGDDLEAHRLDIYIPKNLQTKPKVVIAIYGSAWFSNNMKGMTFMSVGKPLYDAGFAVVCINHRSSGDAPFPSQIQDVKGAIRYIRAHAEEYGLDTSFVGITGFSSGGHLSSLAGVTNGLKEKTVGAVKVDLEGNVGGNLDRVKDANSPEAALIGGAPAEYPELVNLVSPINYVTDETPRFLVIHGEADTVVPHCQSEYFSAVLKEHGKLESFISVPDGQHGPVTFNEQTFKAMTDFFIKESQRNAPN